VENNEIERPVERAPGQSSPSPDREQILREAFLSFQSASESLVSSYAALEKRISDLSEALSEKNQAFDRQGTFLEAILNSLSAGVVVVTPGGASLYRNPAMESFLDPQDPAFILVLSEKGLWPPPDFPEISPMDEAAFDHRGRSWVVVRRPVQGPSALPIGYVFIFTDVTRRREMEMEIARDRRLKAMGEMVAQIAHELRNPLGSLELFTSLLSRDPSSSEAREFLTHMATSISSMDRLIGNLLYHTRTPEMQESAISSPSLVLRMASDFSRVIGSAGKSRPDNTLIFIPPSSIPDVVLTVDEHLLYHAVFNLVTNALEAVVGLPTGEIRFEIIINDNGDYLFIIRDNGPGIAEEVEERIFDPFFTTRAKGTGLGLSIVHNVATAHGGEVRYLREGGHTSFSLSIPKERARIQAVNREEGGRR
jgi:two-component system sensor histidine kinase FlrB